MSGTIPGSIHPRRPPAHKSVSLVHPPRGPAKSPPFGGTINRTGSADSDPSSNKAEASSFCESIPKTQKQSSGESSDAGKWFEASNNNFDQSTLSYMDNDPPFYLQPSCSSSSPPVQIGCRNKMNVLRSTELPHPAGVQIQESVGSSADDFRSVIDDLTIENKKLKRRLQKYENTYSGRLKEEKLFEIRVHGLPPEKKRELEETLKTFALSLHVSQETMGKDSPPEHSRPNLQTRQTASSMTSHFEDSAYASMSTSGQGQNASTPFVNRADRSKDAAAKLTRTNQSVQSYLHEIPESLLPRQNVHLSDKAKKKLIVRRLEQLFAGKGAAVDGPRQSMQQQEVSKSAARADRRWTESQGHTARAEGNREAKLMGQPSGSHNDSPQGSSSTTSIPQRDLSGLRRVSTGNSTPDQRPTRPLDLDPQRAQVPRDNLRYIRHLGFSPLDPELEEPQEEGHGWIYLNVLTNMAQLHTLNVTPDFVKLAIEEYSSKLDISHDGRKVRWKGGGFLTRTSSDNSTDPASEGTSSDNKNRPKQSPRKKSRKNGSQPQASSGANLTTQVSSSTTSRNAKLDYVPLFSHNSGSDVECEPSPGDEYSLPSSPEHPNLLVESSQMNSSGAATSSKSKMRRDDGPIIFYDNAMFCTDLTGDPSSIHNPTESQNVWRRAIGDEGSSPPHSGSDSDQLKLPLSRSIHHPDHADIMDIDDSNPSTNENEVKFPSSSSSSDEKSPENSNILDMEASGLGGVVPQDNFSVDVQTQIRQPNYPGTSAPIQSNPFSHRFREILGERGQVKEQGSHMGSYIKQDVISAKHKTLPNSELPPPSYLIDDSGTEDEDSTSDEDDSELQGFSPPYPLQPLQRAPQALRISPGEDPGENESSDEDSDMEDVDNDDDDESLDLLATARDIDPVAIRAKERQFDSEMAERLAEEIPAGSSAATRGGGSGFNSPYNFGDSDHGHDDPKRSVGLKRNRSGESEGAKGKSARVSQ
ncbi:hypothetical protein M501DRAFT_999796 [Patellaria atrata CBS 101060]|uniref:Frequency clock protein n=1 Tax=Patellaria atrata CBS 101060 TaxID=1346257 RepID=A0A9P4S258_9PEZI|nr:hypothetical protein M501DRAFT_999796 [Patellaria atrata CBS 101060]